MNHPPVMRIINPQDIKIEVDIEEDTISVPCRLCTKTFASEMALRNHFNVEHTSAWEAGIDPGEWNKPIEPKSDSKKMKSPKKARFHIDSKEEEMRKAEFLSSLKPVNLMSLASQDVSYIIIKAEDGVSQEVTSGRKKKGHSEKNTDKAETVPKRPYTRRDKDPAPITGPFECLQPSTVVADSPCHQIFFSCCEYSTHFRDEHTKRRKGLRCQVCEKSLQPGLGDIVDSPFACQVCGEAHNNNKSLQEHINTAHVKLKPFQCNICHKRFTQQGGLIQHNRMHTGDRPYPCTFCSKAFTQKSGLDQHLRIHTKVKPYRCVICSKTFSQSVHLKQHMRTHTNVSPFQCGICQKRFKQSSHLNYHLKSHTEGSMTDEQKLKLAELIHMVEDKSVEMGESEHEVVVGDSYQVDDDMDGDEQAVIVETDPQYVMQEGDETWTIKLVEDGQ